MVTFQKYQVSAVLRRLKIGTKIEDWVLLGIMAILKKKKIRQEIPEERSHNTVPRLAYLLWNPHLHITPRAKTLALNKCTENPEAFTNIWMGGCQWHLHLAYLEKQFHPKTKKEFNWMFMFREETTMQQTETRQYFPTPNQCNSIVASTWRQMFVRRTKGSKP